MKDSLILIVEQDQAILGALAAELRDRYGDRFEITQAASAGEALERLREHGPSTAMVLSGEDGGGMELDAFVQQTARLAPQASRVLLVNGSEPDALTAATRGAGIATCVPCPWTPADVHLYPALDDLLANWLETNRERGDVMLLGHRWSPEAHELRDFLTRNLVPYRWHDLSAGRRGHRILREHGLSGAQLPVVLLPDGSALQRPSVAVLADQLGLPTHPDETFYDVAIVGGGPAGLAAAVYAASEGLRTVLIEKEAPGGQAGQSSRIENYLGFPEGLSGADLTRRASLQARKFDAEILSPQGVNRIELRGQYRCLTLENGDRFSCHTVILAVGAEYRRLDAPGVRELIGAGVYYGAPVTEASSCRDEVVFVVGGGNSAGQAALHYARYARRVVIVIRGESLEHSMSAYLIEQIEATPNVEVRARTEVAGARGQDHLEALELRHNGTGERETVPATALFILIGAEPRTRWLAGLVARDDRGYILTGPDLGEDGERPAGWPLQRDPYLLETSVPGVFAVGDVRHASIKRVASAVGEGAAAVAFVHRYLSEL